MPFKGTWIISAALFWGCSHDFDLVIDESKSSSPQVNLQDINLKSEITIGETYSDTLPVAGDGEKELEFILLTGPGNMEINNSIISWVPDEDDAGNQVLIAGLKDEEGKYDLVEWNVYVNSPPEFNQDNLPGELATVGVQYVSILSGNDEDGDEIRYSLVERAGEMILFGNKIVWTPEVQHLGDNSVSVQLSDSRGGTTLLPWTIYVQNVDFSQLDPREFNSQVLTGDMYSDTIPRNQDDVLEIIDGPDGLNLDGDILTLDNDSLDPGDYNVSILNIHQSGVEDTLDFVITIVEPLVVIEDPDLVEVNRSLEIIRAGTFVMGSEEIGEDAVPAHEVTLSAFRIDATEVTQGDYSDVMQSAFPEFTVPAWNSDQGLGENYPAYNVNWYDAVLFTVALSLAEGLEPVYSYTGISGIPGNDCVLEGLSININANGFRLPTEAEWEYAARGGTTTEYYWDAGDARDFAWFNSNSGLISHEVSTKQANEYGLYDMSGNVWEWTHDFFGPYTSDKVVNPVGPESGESRVIRGGGWFASQGYMRSGFRGYGMPDNKIFNLGFRVVLPG